MDFFSYWLVNANLFVRPAELIPGLENVPFYFWFILVCLIVSMPRLASLLAPQSPLRHPVSICVFGILITTALSHLVASDGERLLQEIITFGKVVVYYVLFLALVNSPGKLRCLLASVVFFGMITTTASILAFHDYFELPNRPALAEMVLDESTGQYTPVRRLMIVGILRDPNDCCVFLSVLCLLTLHWLTRRGAGLGRWLWLVPMALFLYGIYLTKSRGGLLALFAGLGGYAVCAWGVRRSVIAGVLLMPVLAGIVMFGGRQTEISISRGTARERIDIWSDWMMTFRGNLVFGVGPRTAAESDLGFTAEEKKALQFENQLLAHNSYLQSFADLGVVGGMCFVGAFVLGFRSLTRYRGQEEAIVDPEQRQLFPFVFGALAAYMMGMFSLSLCYLTPTYFVLAIPVVFARTTVTLPRIEELRFDGASARTVVTASVGVLALILFCIKFLRV